MAIDIKHIDYPARVQSGNINATAVAKATELAGFRQVNKLTDLYAISDFVLSDSGDNTNNDALMQQWWVQEQGKFYSLINWDNRKQADGWYAVKSISSGPTENRPTNPEIGDIYFDTTLGKVVYWDGTKWVNASGKTPANSYGTTEQRPTLTDKDTGYIYFDTTVNRPIFWNGNTWIDLLLDYKVNNHSLSTNPVLQGSDLIVNKNYNISGIDDVGILSTDTVYKAIAKLDVKGNSTNSRVDKAEINISGLTDNYNTLKGRLDNINSAYQFVASVDSLDKLKSYPVDNNTQVRNGAVFNVNAAFTLGDKPYPAGTNVAVNATVAAGTAITDAQLDPLGGQVDVSAITGDIDSLRKVVYNNHAQAQISVSPNVIFKGTDTKVIVSWRASLQGLDNPKINYIVKKGDSNFYPDSVTREEFFAEVTSKSDTVNDNTTYNLTATVEGVNLTRSASVTAVYPIYYKSETGDVTALPDGAVQYANPVTSANITVTYNPSSTCYLYIFIPDSMSITTAQFNSASGNSPLPITQQNNITVDGKGTYKVYRSAMRQVAGSYSVTYKA